MQNAVVLALIVIGVLALWAFYNFKPEFGDKKAISVFNICIILVAIMLSVAWSFKVYGALMGPQYAELWPYLAAGGAFLIWITSLAVGFVLRNFWIFRVGRKSGNMF